jgi:hypothetical protein
VPPLLGGRFRVAREATVTQAMMQLAAACRNDRAREAERSPLLAEAVSQTNGTGAKQQRLGGQRKRDASGELLRASAGSAGLICLDAERCSWRSITNNFWSVTFVKQPRLNGTARRLRRDPAQAGRS